MKSSLFEKILFGMLAAFAVAVLSMTYWVLFMYSSCTGLGC